MKKDYENKIEVRDFENAEEVEENSEDIRNFGSTEEKSKGKEKWRRRTLKIKSGLQILKI